MRTKKSIELIKNEQERQDIGFGTKIIGKETRLINRNGNFNVKLINQPFKDWLNLYNRLIIMSWTRFGFLIIGMFLLVNLFFASLYSLIGTEHLAGVIAESPIDRFTEAFFFSTQTLTTVGYGRISPVGFLASVTASTESLMGLLSFAIATGLLYGKFSRPIAHIRYSTKALIAPYLDTQAFMFRIINERSHQLIEVNAEVVLSRLEKKEDGSLTRKYFALKLERNRVNFFPSNWTLVHAITEDSPLYGLTEKDLDESETEIMILIKGFDDAFAQQVHSRNSYTSDEMVWNAKFVNMQENVGNMTVVDLSKLSDYQIV
ncbi:MAG: ion channel [Bacteroidota bacterium]